MEVAARSNANCGPGQVDCANGSADGFDAGVDCADPSCDLQSCDAGNFWLRRQLLAATACAWPQHQNLHPNDACQPGWSLRPSTVRAAYANWPRDALRRRRHLHFDSSCFAIRSSTHRALRPANAPLLMLARIDVVVNCVMTFDTTEPGEHLRGCAAGPAPIFRGPRARRRGEMCFSPSFNDFNLTTAKASPSPDPADQLRGARARQTSLAPSTRGRSRTRPPTGPSQRLHLRRIDRPAGTLMAGGEEAPSARRRHRRRERRRGRWGLGWELLAIPLRRRLFGRAPAARAPSSRVGRAAARFKFRPRRCSPRRHALGERRRWQRRPDGLWLQRGGAGGSGGAILLEAAQLLIQATARITANGGAGAGGAMRRPRTNALPGAEWRGAERGPRCRGRKRWR